MKRRISWQRAKQLCPLGQCAGVLAAICVVLRLILLGMGYAVQRMGQVLHRRLRGDEDQL